MHRPTLTDGGQPPDDDPPLDDQQKRDLARIAGVTLIAVAAALGVAQFLALGTVADSTLRLYLLFGTILIAGREAIRAYLAG